jgi:hypothetical protein
VTGTTDCLPSVAAASSSAYSAISCSHAASTLSSSAMSAIEQPAARLGRITCCSGRARMSAVSAMKWTPQKTMVSAAGLVSAALASWKESPTKSAYCTTSSRW